MSQFTTKDEETLWGISKLEGGSNYHEWSYDAEMVLRGKGLWSIVEGTETVADAASVAARRDFDTRASLALSILTRSIQHVPKMHVYAERDSAKIWKCSATNTSPSPKGRFHQVSLRPHQDATQSDCCR